MYHAKLILGSYRADQANDPEIYVTAISHLLSRYPKDIGARLTDPKDGVAGKYKWLPSVSEVREEADRLQAAEAAKQYRASEWAEQFRVRKEQETLDKSESWEHRQKVTARIMAEYKAKVTPPKLPDDTWKRFTVDDLKAMYARADGETSA